LAGGDAARQEREVLGADLATGLAGKALFPLSVGIGGSVLLLGMFSTTVMIAYFVSNARSGTGDGMACAAWQMPPPLLRLLLV